MLSVRVILLVQGLLVHRNQRKLFDWKTKPAGFILSSGHGPESSIDLVVRSLSEAQQLVTIASKGSSNSVRV